MGCHVFAAGGTVLKYFGNAGWIFDIYRWDFVVEFRYYQAGRCWRAVTVTELGTVKHL